MPERVLPQTPETRRGPGFWATNTPHDEPEITFNWDVPVPESDEPAAERVRTCAKDMKAASPKVLRQHDVERLDKLAIFWRDCWPHSLVLYCLSAEQDGLGMVRPMNRMQQNHWDVLARAIKHAKNSWADHCNAVPWEPDMRHLVDAAVRARYAK